MSEEGRMRLKKMDDPPKYIVIDGYDQVWEGRIRNGIDVTREYLGNYGPVYVYVLGEETDELADPAAREALIDAYCGLRSVGVPELFLRTRTTPGGLVVVVATDAGTSFDAPAHPLADETSMYAAFDRLQCREGPGLELFEKARKGRDSEAYLSGVPYADPPIAELVFTNPHSMGGPIETGGIHEYTHVFQLSHRPTPTWMMEGGAVFLASYLGDRNGWCEFVPDLESMLENLEYQLREHTDFEDRNAFYEEFGIHQMEDIDAASDEVKPYYWHLAYMTGSWAVAYMIHRSPTRSVGDFHTDFYALVDRAGWEDALAEYTGFPDKEAFYEGFSEFITLEPRARRKMLEELRD